MFTTRLEIYFLWIIYTIENFIKYMTNHHVQNEIYNTEESVTFLGIYIDKHLTWKKHQYNQF